MNYEETIKEILAKYWYYNEYILLDKTNHKICEESRLKFQKWLDNNQNLFITIKNENS